ncbi:MAG: hypothetical protein AW07_04402 [Candidatus Accumulibacter sp. SK-11]|nr:MAG: hypothetical protein AW07_04402 [Candidatus Accumulibacter sp. SK-11]
MSRQRAGRALRAPPALSGLARVPALAMGAAASVGGFGAGSLAVLGLPPAAAVVPLSFAGTAAAPPSRLGAGLAGLTLATVAGCLVVDALSAVARSVPDCALGAAAVGGAAVPLRGEAAGAGRAPSPAGACNAAAGSCRSYQNQVPAVSRSSRQPLPTVSMRERWRLPPTLFIVAAAAGLMPRRGARRVSMPATRSRKPAASAEPSQPTRSAAWMPRKPSGGRTASISAGTSLSRMRASSASSLTQVLASELDDQRTTMQPISFKADSITCRQVFPAGILRSHQTLKPSASSWLATSPAVARSSVA